MADTPYNEGWGDGTRGRSPIWEVLEPVLINRKWLADYTTGYYHGLYVVVRALIERLGFDRGESR